MSRRSATASIGVCVRRSMPSAFGLGIIAEQEAGAPLQMIGDEQAGKFLTLLQAAFRRDGIQLVHGFLNHAH